MCFNVYSDNRSGQIDYEQAVATVQYRGPVHYTCDTVVESGSYSFVICAEDAVGRESWPSCRVRIEIQNVSLPSVQVLNTEAI